MNKAELFFRAIEKATEEKPKGRGRPSKNAPVDKTKIHGGFENNTKKVIIPVDFSSKGQLFVADLVFANTFDPESNTQTLTETAEVYSNKYKKESDKQVIPLAAFLYNLVFSQEQYEEFEEFREELRKQIAFDKNEVKTLKQLSAVAESEEA